MGNERIHIFLKKNGGVVVLKKDNTGKINFLDFVEKFDKKDKNDEPYYLQEFYGVYDIDKDERGNYHIINLDDFSVVCELPVWLELFFLIVEKRSKVEIAQELKNILKYCD